jgi:hypothetical protein
MTRDWLEEWTSASRAAAGAMTELLGGAAPVGGRPPLH